MQELVDAVIGACVAHTFVPRLLVLRPRGAQAAKHHDQLLPVGLHAEALEHLDLVLGHKLEVFGNAVSQFRADRDARHGRDQVMVQLVDRNVVEA